MRKMQKALDRSTKKGTDRTGGASTGFLKRVLADETDLRHLRGKWPQMMAWMLGMSEE